MTQLYSAAGSFSGINTAGKVWADIYAGAASRPKVKRITLAMPVACSTVPAFQIRRATTAGTTPVNTLTPMPFDGNENAATSTSHTQGYTTDGTLTATPLDVGAFPLTAGAAWVWNFGEPGIFIPVGTGNGLVLYNANASGATLGTFLFAVLFEE